MPTNSNGFDYTRDFNGNLRTHSTPVPMHVKTRVKVLSQPTSAEIRRYRSRIFDAPPQYFYGRGHLPLPPSRQAVGKHFFTW